MIDPTQITNFSASKQHLQEMLLFWICAAGKSGRQAARVVNELISSCSKNSLPFTFIKKHSQEELAIKLKSKGMGCHSLKSKSMLAVSNSTIDLTFCSVEDLELFPGIGPKTARCFILHSRQDAQVAALDTHILKYLRSQGFDAPKSTPSSKKIYASLEQEFLRLAKEAGKHPAIFDLEIWNSYASISAKS
jgi:thermostable 8-oxoguanine DNA glycosylase